MLLLVLSLTLSSSPYRPVPADPLAVSKASGPKEVRVTMEKKPGQSCAAAAAVAKLPFARGKSFCALDDYLAHLKVQGAIDLPWWRLVRPGVYEHVKTMTGAPRETATRTELMKRFGFSR